MDRVVLLARSIIAWMVLLQAFHIFFSSLFLSSYHRQFNSLNKSIGIFGCSIGS